MWTSMFSYTRQTSYIFFLKSHGCLIDHVFSLGLRVTVILVSMQPRYEINVGTKKP